MRFAPFSFATRKAVATPHRDGARAAGKIGVLRGRFGSTAIVLCAAAAGILVSGWLAATFVLMHAPEAPVVDAVAYKIVGNHVYPVPLAESRRQKLLVQQMGGDMAIRIAEFDAWLHSLLHPPRLAWTLLALSTVVAAGCLRFARLSAEQVED